MSEKGLEVIGTCSAKSIDFVKSLGANHVIDYNNKNVVDRCLAITGVYKQPPLSI